MSVSRFDSLALGAALGLAACASAPELPAHSTLRVVSSRSAPPAASDGCGALSWPVEAPLSSPFGRRDGRAHDGIDLAAPEDTEVRAACDGVVSYAADQLRGYGRVVMLEHADGLTTVYAHNRTLLVAPGQRVARGQVIARSGATGHVTAPHLHFEVREQGRAIDPLPRLDARTPSIATR